MRDYRAGRLELFASSRPGPRTEPKKDSARKLTLALRREGRSLAEIDTRAEGGGHAVGAHRDLGGGGRGRTRPTARRGAARPRAPSLPAPKAQRLGPPAMAAGRDVSSEHAGLFLLRARAARARRARVSLAAAGYPGTSQLTAVNSLLALLALKLLRAPPPLPRLRRRARPRARRVLRADGVCRNASHLSGYSYRTTRAHNQALLEALVPRQQAAGLIDGESFNLDFHAIMSYGEDQILEEHYVPTPLATDPLGAHVLRPGRRARDALLRQHRHRQGRPGARDHPLLRVLAAQHRAEAPACWCSTRR